MGDFKLKIRNTEIKIDENTFNYIRDDTLMPKVEVTNANFEDRTIDFKILYNADPLRLINFLKWLTLKDYRFCKRKKRITKKKFKIFNKVTNKKISNKKN